MFQVLGPDPPVPPVEKIGLARGKMEKVPEICPKFSQISTVIGFSHISPPTGADCLATNASEVNQRNLKLSRSELRS